MEISIIERPHTLAEIIEYTKQEITDFSIKSILSSVFGKIPKKPYESIYRVYFPMFIAEASVTFNENKRERIQLGVNGVTGSVGQINELPKARKQDIDGAAIISPVISKEKARSKADEWLFKHLDRSYRLFRMPDYDLELRECHLLYWLVDRGSFENSYAINDLTERRDSVDRLKGIDEYYHTQIVGK